jgi:hypothetical protein
MNMYAILCHPGHNRVYFEESKNFVLNELSIAAGRMSVKIQNIRLQNIAGIQYLIFEADEDLTAQDLKLLSQLSFIFALFKYDTHFFIPIELSAFGYVDQNISKILKYTGKTNEIFTRLLINIAVFSSDFSMTDTLKLLDPIAGKGTTLFEGLVCNYDVYGIEIGEKVVTEAYNFLKKFLEKEKYKHTVKLEKISGKNRLFTAHRYNITISKTKDAVKSKECREFEIISGNSFYANQLYKKNYFNFIVGDLPYGIQHSSVTNEKQSQFTRNPKELLISCLPVWKDLLIKNGIIVLSWNTFVLSRKELVKIFEDNGFDVFSGENYVFEHRVDQAINRDIIAAKKK